jgi:hypothetical protein
MYTSSHVVSVPLTCPLRPPASPVSAFSVLAMSGDDTNHEKTSTTLRLT